MQLLLEESDSLRQKPTLEEYGLPRWLSLSMQETQVRSLGQEDPLEEEMATYSSILAWEIPWTEEHGGLQSRWL